jgi:hypothetical protein
MAREARLLLPASVQPTSELAEQPVDNPSAPAAPSIPTNVALKTWVPIAMQAYPRKPDENPEAWGWRLWKECGSECDGRSVANEVRRILKAERERLAEQENAGSCIKKAADCIK